MIELAQNKWQFSLFQGHFAVLIDGKVICCTFNVLFLYFCNERDRIFKIKKLIKTSPSCW